MAAASGRGWLTAAEAEWKGGKGGRKADHGVSYRVEEGDVENKTKKK